MSEPSEKSPTGKVQKIVVNRCFGGFGLSDTALDMLVDEYGFETTDYDDEGEFTNPDADIIDGEGHVTHHYKLINKREAETRVRDEIIEVVERLGEDANGSNASLDIVEVPLGMGWSITEYDGVETVREKHRKWPGGDWEDGIMSSEEV